MKKIKCFGFLMICGLLFTGAVYAQKNKFITGNSVGVIKIGMSAATARKLLRPLKVSKGVNVFEGDMLSKVTDGKKLVMEFIEYFKKITLIEVWDPSYHTAEGARIGMKLEDLEKMYGPIKEIYTGEQDGNEYAVFAGQPKGIKFNVAVPEKGKLAGIYHRDENSRNRFRTTKYKPGIYLKMISVDVIR